MVIHPIPAQNSIKAQHQLCLFYYLFIKWLTNTSLPKILPKLQK